VVAGLVSLAITSACVNAQSSTSCWNNVWIAPLLASAGYGLYRSLHVQPEQLIERTVGIAELQLAPQPSQRTATTCDATKIELGLAAIINTPSFEAPVYGAVSSLFETSLTEAATFVLPLTTAQQRAFAMQEADLFAIDQQGAAHKIDVGDRCSLLFGVASSRLGDSITARETRGGPERLTTGPWCRPK
jgi:hypothetical protein